MRSRLISTKESEYEIVLLEFSGQIDALAAVADSLVGSALVDVIARVFVWTELIPCWALADVVPHDVLALAGKWTCTRHLKIAIQIVLIQNIFIQKCRAVQENCWPETKNVKSLT
jgi:hypothetical protein